MDVTHILAQDRHLFLEEIEERSPAMSLPYDIFSIILLGACREYWRALFIFGAVCRTWRHYAIDTPQAWSLVPLRRIKSFDAISTILERRASYLSHIAIDETVDRELGETLMRYSERIYCLRVDCKYPEVLHHHSYSNLTKLVFTGYHGDYPNMDKINVLDGTKFPRLRCLGVKQLKDPGAETVLPPIEELSLTVGSFVTYANEIIQRLASQLTLLRVVYLPYAHGQLVRDLQMVPFPRLLHLKFVFLAIPNDYRWPFNSPTPALRSYPEPSVPALRKRHVDTETPNQQGSLTRFDLRLFPHLREITSSPSGALAVIRALEDDPEGCPDLMAIGSAEEYSGKDRVRLEAFNIKHMRKISLTSLSHWDYISEILFLTLCDNNMECKGLLNPKYPNKAIRPYSCDPDGSNRPSTCSAKPTLEIWQRNYVSCQNWRYVHDTGRNITLICYHGGIPLSLDPEPDPYPSFLLALCFSLRSQMERVSCGGFTGIQLSLSSYLLLQEAGGLYLLPSIIFSHKGRQDCNPLVKEKVQSMEQRAATLNLPYDILSLILLEACREDWKAPFILGGVCRWWRQSVLDTPQAWSLVHLSCIRTPDAIPVILDRGAPYPLHLVISEKVDRQLRDKLTRYPERVHCLRIDYKHFEILPHRFSNLTKLVCTGDPSNVEDKIVLDGTMFPKLRCLRVQRLLNYGWNTILPPIEELSFRTNNLPYATELIRRLAPQLTLLRVFYLPSARVSPPGERILFPRLLYLTIIEISMSRNAWWPFDAQTPVLQSYDEFKRPRPHNMHKDTKTVKQLLFDREIDLKLFPQLREVTAGPSGIRSMLDSLETDPQDWPDLQTLYCSHSDNIVQTIDNFNHKHCRNIDIRSITRDITLPSGNVFGTFLLSPCGMNRECDVSPHEY